LVCIKAVFPVTDQPLRSSPDEVAVMPKACQQLGHAASYRRMAMVDADCHTSLSDHLGGVPVASILYRAGRSRWWTVIAFIPLINLIGLWIFAFSRWPAVDRASS
jgi:hypothetical protein